MYMGKLEGRKTISLTSDFQNVFEAMNTSDNSSDVFKRKASLCFLNKSCYNKQGFHVKPNGSRKMVSP
jgi:site-specific DNA-adenine methylase